jgi:hypothetical protein
MTAIPVPSSIGVIVSGGQEIDGETTWRQLAVTLSAAWQPALTSRSQKWTAHIRLRRLQLAAQAQRWLRQHLPLTPRARPGATSQRASVPALMMIASGFAGTQAPILVTVPPSAPCGLER